MVHTLEDRSAGLQDQLSPEGEIVADLDLGQGRGRLLDPEPEKTYNQKVAEGSEKKQRRRNSNLTGKAEGGKVRRSQSLRKRSSSSKAGSGVEEGRGGIRNSSRTRTSHPSRSRRRTWHLLAVTAREEFGEGWRPTKPVPGVAPGTSGVAPRRD